MSGLERILPIAFVISGLGASAAEMPPEPNFGAPVSAAELARYRAIPPSGAGLPPGRGDVARGAEVYTTKCAACHGEHLEGVKDTGGPALLGGRGTLATAKPLKTVESYWPYATTIFDYVKRAMPFNAPGSLADDEVYAVTAFVLASAHIVPETAALDAASLAKVEMPNRNGFYPDPRRK
jgi:S-disulfanyl-L-cysteine oxidoreductase SoxD